MNSFFKAFFACLLALIVFTGGLFLLMLLFVGLLARTADKPAIAERSVLVLDLSRTYSELPQEDLLAEIRGDRQDRVPSLYHMLRILDHASRNPRVEGLYIKATTNGNGYASSEELRNAVQAFKRSGKWVIAFGDVMNQEAYYVASAADRVYIHPKGGLEWQGMSVTIPFLKGTLEKLGIEAQVFYAGQFKSATEPLREKSMTEANRLQTSVWLHDIFNQYMRQVAVSRKLDTSRLRLVADSLLLRSATDALNLGMVDGLKYEDEVQAEIKKKTRISATSAIRFVSPGTYDDAESLFPLGKSKRIAVVYAQGDIVYGEGQYGEIGSDSYRKLLRRLRYDKSCAGIVLRVNSPGGSSLASEIIWREISLLRKEGKPVIVSMGDVAASGGYYIACEADSILVQNNTLTGSIGVFGVIPNFRSFLDDKLGVTFDGVKTSPYADMGSVVRPLSEFERRVIQASVDSTYEDFKARVAGGRKLSMAYVDTVAQGRVWTGKRAVALGLADRIGDLQDAVKAAAALAGVRDYGIREYPAARTWIEQLFRDFGGLKQQWLRDEIGTEQYNLYVLLEKIRKWTGTVQARLPYDLPAAHY